MIDPGFPGAYASDPLSVEKTWCGWCIGNWAFYIDSRGEKDQQFHALAGQAAFDSREDAEFALSQLIKKDRAASV